jgi:hypothetical protein
MQAVELKDVQGFKPCPVCGQNLTIIEQPTRLEGKIFKVMCNRGDHYITTYFWGDIDSLRNCWVKRYVPELVN